MGQSYTTMSSLIRARKGEADADLAINCGRRGIKSEPIDNSASTMSESTDPDMNLAVTQVDAVTLARKEKAVADGVLFLNNANDTIASHTLTFPELKNWQNQIRQILASIKRPRVLVGLLGYTGSGKSSLINALIDEETIVPANSMRASTSVVTEISWNESDDPDKAFRAEIEFISEDEWKQEMEILLNDLEHATKGEDISVRSGSEASTAFAKISAVWPEVTLAKLKGITSDELFHKVDGVSDILDCQLEIFDGKAKPFAEKVDTYIDSNNKETSSKGISYWPLVRCVRIFTKAEILRHGLVLVDLPGLGDSITGRTQVAENHMQNLEHIWIVADIVRAIDDQIAKDLMGNSFRRQLLMDGKYDCNYVTFIMTKTDIINNDEVISSLQLRHRVLKDILAREQELMQNIHNIQETLLRRTKKNKKVKKVLKELLEGMKSTKDSKALPRKRKFVDDRAKEDVSSANSKLLGKLSEKNLMIQKKNDSVNAIKAMNKKLAGLRAELKSIRNAIKVACTQARNDYTQRHLKMDFENGLRELEQDISYDLNDQSEDENEVERKQIEDLTGQFNTFCVSSEGYQRLAGRFKRDPIPRGFATMNDTCIPALKVHATASTLTERTTLANGFLNEFNLLKLSIKSWVENDTPTSLSSSQKDKLNATLEEHLVML
ncbi:hypothetical protein EAF04_010096 [Stromatinia cepivora]|nr:hypothetical protein EAF04_010096 [Stromatinia cepivora]